jgi:ATP-dependent RNA helicase RhlE
LESIRELGLGLANGLADLPAGMQRNLTANGVDKLFPVQESTFNLFANEQNELIVKSRTGTGKTLSFLLPLEYLIRHSVDKQDNNGARNSKRAVKAIILEPTRELATQVQHQVEKFTSLRSCLLYGGGESKNVQCKYPFVSHNPDCF